MRSDLFNHFLAGVQAPITWTNIDEYEGIGALPLLAGEERAEAENILIGKLAEDDGRAANALAEIGCTRAIPALAERAERSPSPTMRVFAARALRTLGDDSGRPALLQVLRTGGWQDRLSAVKELAEYPGAETETALGAHFADPDTTVRSAAIAAFLRLRGLAEYDTSYRDVLGNIHGRMLSPLRSVRDEAETELREILARWGAGEPPQQLGLTWHADEDAEPLRSFVASLASADPPWQEGYALDGLDALTGRDRKWIEDLLLNQLTRDRRAVRAVARLGVTRAVPPLTELLSDADAPLAAEVQAALNHLTR